MTHPRVRVAGVRARGLFLSLLALLLTTGGLFVSIAPAHAAMTFTVGNLSYTTNDDAPGTVTVNGPAAPGQSIPSFTIGADVSDGTTTYLITAIANGAFMNRNLQDLNLSGAANLTTIGFSAFLGNHLTQITIPDSVTSIGVNAFYNNKLTQVSLSNSLKTIETYLLSNNQLAQVTIPDSVTSIGDSAFYDNKLTQVTIPGTVHNVGVGAFFTNQLTQVNISDGVVNLGPGSFAENQLTHATIPQSVTSIGVDAFSENPLESAAFLGTAPTDFAPRTRGGSLGDRDVTVYFPKAFGPEGDHPSFTAPFWQGYRSQQFPDLSYDPNAQDVTGDIAPTDATSAPSFTAGLPTWNVETTQNTFTRPGFSFLGWNTKADGTGDWYQPGNQITLDKDGATLYAQWQAIPTVELSYDANEGTGSMAPVSGLVGTKITIPQNTFTRPGFSFLGWNTKADGTGDWYQPGNQITLDKDDATLYAQWQAIPMVPGGGGSAGGGPVASDGGSAGSRNSPFLGQGTLPYTGTSGIVFLAAVGALVLIGAGGLLTRRRRAQA